MHFSFRGDGDGFNLNVEVQWSTLIALLKAILAATIVVAPLLAALANFGH